MAIYGSVTALTTFEQIAWFKLFLKLEPQVREIIQCDFKLFQIQMKFNIF